MYSYKFYKEAEKDLDKLNNSVKILFAEKLSQIVKNPDIGKDLGNKNNLNLAGLKKVYFDNKKYRIVYKVKEMFIYIIAIGKRDDMKVYKQASKRFNE